jgi:hypothetical protein
MANLITTKNTVEASQTHMGVQTEKQRPSKDEWIRHYAGKVLHLWHQWQTPLGVGRDYVEHISQELSSLYEEPLKRAFIEATYSK